MLVALMTVLLLTQRRKGGSGPPFTATQSIFNALGFIWCVIGTIWVHDGVWYDKDFYLVTRGEGVTVKRNFEE